MLCPEVWNFKACESTTHIKTGQTYQNTISKTVKTFLYNHLVSVIIPDALKVPEILTDKLNIDCEYYKISSFKISELVDVAFLNGFIKTGTLSLLSIGTRIDCDNCFCVTPSGQIVLNIDKETYQSLGLEGEPSHFTLRIKDRYKITIDLKSPNKHLNKVKGCLEKLGAFNVIATWEPYDKSICPSSLAKHFDSLGYEVKLCVPKYETHTSYSVNVPEIRLESVEEYDLELFLEWLGLLANFCETEVPDHLSSYKVPEPCHQVGQVKCLQWRGFFTGSQLEEFIQQIQKYALVDKKEWVAVYIQGFSDSPVAWGQEEHHFYTNGDNGYTVICDGKSFLLTEHKCSKKRYK